MNKLCFNCKNPAEFIALCVLQPIQNSFIESGRFWCGECGTGRTFSVKLSKTAPDWEFYKLTDPIKDLHVK